MKLKLFSKDYFFATILAFSLLWVLLPILTNVDFIDPIQNALEDVSISDIVFSKIRDNQEVPMDTNIILVNIGRMSRAGIAKQIKNIIKHKPKVLGIDSFFREAKDSTSDEALAAAIRSSDNIVIASQLKDLNNETMNFDTLIKSYELFSAGVKTGFANLHIDDDAFRTCRKTAIKETAGNITEYSFALKILSIYSPEKYNKLLERDNEIETINYRRNMNKYRVIDADEAVSDTADFSFMEGKIVLLGFLGIDTARKSTEDIYFSPMNERFIGKSLPDIYGVVIHSNILSQFISEDYINELDMTYIIILFALMIYFNIMLFYNLEENLQQFYEPLSILIPIIEIVILILIALTAFHKFNYIIEVEKIIFAIFFCSPAYELYNGSIKHIAQKIIQRRRSK